MIDKERIEKAVKEMLEAMNLDLEDENFRKTPQRVARMYEEMFEGLGNEKKVKEILQTNFPSTYRGMIVSDWITAYSACPHHIIPVDYKVRFAYIPDGRVLGLSKVARFIKLISKRPVLQEQLTDDIVDYFERIVRPLGCIAVVKGSHACMRCRGVKDNAQVITSSIRGNFEDKTVKDEFLKLIGMV